MVRIHQGASIKAKTTDRFTVFTGSPFLAARHAGEKHLVELWKQK